MKKTEGTGHRPNEGTRLSAEALFRAHAAFCARFLGQLGVALADRDDLVQEIFVIAHRQGGFVTGAAAPTTWLAQIAIRVVSNYRRSRRRHPEAPLEDEDAPGGASLDVVASVEARRSLRLVGRALDALELEHRAVFVLYELEGKSGAEIAEVLEVPVGTVHSRLHYARARFLEVFARLEKEAAPKGRTSVEGK